MYDNIGVKIKGLAKATFIVETIGAVIVGIYLMLDGGPNGVIEGLAVMLLGPIVAWVSSWLLYAFGQLVENSDIVAKNSQTPAAPPAAQQEVAPSEASDETCQEVDGTDLTKIKKAETAFRIFMSCVVIIAVILFFVVIVYAVQN